MDLYHLREEAEPTDRTALEAVVDHIKEELARLNVRRRSAQLRAARARLRASRQCRGSCRCARGC